GVGHDVDRVAEQAGQKSRDKAQAQHKDDVDVRALVAVVVWSGGQVQTRRVGVADIEQRLVQVGRINRIYIWRVVRAVAVSHRGTCGSACIGEHRSRQARVGQDAVDRALDRTVIQKWIGACARIE